MKKVEFLTLVSSSVEELQSMLKRVRVELLKSRMAIKTGKEKNVSRYVFQRRLVAQILTAIRQKKDLK